MKINNKSQGFILGFLAIIIALIAYMAFSEVNRGDNQEAYTKTTQDEISAQEREKIKDLTYSFFATFKEGVPLNESILTDVTYQYFDKDFLQDTFPKEKLKLFGIYGYGKLTHHFTNVDGLQESGGIKSFEIQEIQEDNVNKVITVYVRMDALESNTIHWLEWRNVPGEGWKINSVSFDGNIEALSSPISPKS